MPGRARHLRLPQRLGEPDAAAAGEKGRRALDRAHLRALPEPERAHVQPGHEAFGRRAADARHRPHPAHGRAPPASRRADGRARPRHRAADRLDHPGLARAGLHHPARRAELPVRGDGGGPPLRGRARAGDRHDPQCQPRGQPRQAENLSWRLNKILER